MKDNRLDQFIHRIKAQRACLNMAARLVAGMEGPILELGLGNGRTYDHLRELFPGRKIFVFERDVSAHPDCIPDSAHLLRGEFKDTVPGSLAQNWSRICWNCCGSIRICPPPAPAAGGPPRPSLPPPGAPPPGPKLGSRFAPSTGRQTIRRNNQLLSTTALVNSRNGQLLHTDLVEKTLSHPSRTNTRKGWDYPVAGHHRGRPDLR